MTNPLKPLLKRLSSSSLVYCYHNDDDYYTLKTLYNNDVIWEAYKHKLVMVDFVNGDFFETEITGLSAEQYLEIYNHFKGISETYDLLKQQKNSLSSFIENIDSGEK